MYTKYLAASKNGLILVSESAIRSETILIELHVSGVWLTMLHSYGKLVEMHHDRRKVRSVKLWLVTPCN